MSNFDSNEEYFYIKYINKELYKDGFYTRKASYTPRIVFINRVYRPIYWFPSKISDSSKKKKLLREGQKPLYTSFSTSGLDFRDILRLHISAVYKYDFNDYIQSDNFLKILAMLNETTRKQEFKRLLPGIRRFSFNVWKKPPLVNRHLYLRYFYDFSVHRVISRFRKFNFLSLNRWGLSKRWLFAIPKMKTFYLRRKKYRYEYFMFRFYRLPGMSREYWAEQQLQYPYYNLNSFNLLSDTYNSSTFFNHYPPLATDELKHFILKSDYTITQFALFYWFLKNSVDHPLCSLPAYFSYSYPLHHYTYGAKYKYLKNYFAYFTPRYAHAYFSRFRRFNFTNVVASLRWYMFVMRPIYWNLDFGLDLHPHEFWEWMDVSWWEDNIIFRFSRFNKVTRKASFKKKGEPENWLAYYNNNVFWLYKSWVHENLFLELTSSYYKRYYNFKYLTPGSRFQTEYPKKKWGHFDPKWQDRLFEYTYHRHPDQYFLPSTRRFITRYARSVSTRRLDSFIMLNFAWKINKVLLFLPRRLSKKSPLDNRYLRDSLRDFKPSFSENYDNLLNSTVVLPLILNDFSLINKELELFHNNLIFLINFFCDTPAALNVTSIQLDFLISYLSHAGITKLVKTDFSDFKIHTYSDLICLVCKLGSLTKSDILIHKEQIIVEYLAFKRWYTLLISEYNN